jgi:hypothetical protein
LRESWVAYVVQLTGSSRDTLSLNTTLRDKTEDGEIGQEMTKIGQDIIGQDGRGQYNIVQPPKAVAPTYRRGRWNGWARRQGT